MRGTHEEKMYRHPFTFLRIYGLMILAILERNPMWLILIGDCRQKISPTVAYQ
ncbi:MAG: hypothetical protein SAK29_17690 [Scytonema sp. PMC 1069.18]|nr:hypothetical protein [Scytonema sp. PMC 1069.18]MEC4882799.1 hypothetical protein [Scytonema sp. PMC 1070.18]